MNKEEAKMFESVVQATSKILVATMVELDIPNYIESECVSKEYRYKLKFTREKI